MPNIRSTSRRAVAPLQARVNISKVVAPVASFVTACVVFTIFGDYMHPFVVLVLDGVAGSTLVDLGQYGRCGRGRKEERLTLWHSQAAMRAILGECQLLF